MKYLAPGMKHVGVADIESLYFCEWSHKALEFGLSHGLVDHADVQQPKAPPKACHFFSFLFMPPHS